MGVHGLTTFVDDNKHIFLTDHQLHDAKVVIDGSNLFHFLYYHYKISHQFGGDYDHFARKCKHFFNILKQCHVAPFVVFDGGYDPDDRKLPTVLERMNDRRKRVEIICATGRGCVLPILCYETFREVLVELEIAHVSCMYEADREIAVLAKKWKCPVMSNDSDFFIFRLEGGFIPLDYINFTLCVFNTESKIASVLEQNSTVGENEYIYIPAKYYNCARVLKLFKKDKDDHVLPLLGTLLGNDYVDNTVLCSFYHTLHAPRNPSKKSFRVKASNKIEAVLNWVEKAENEEAALELIVDGVTKEKKDNVREVIVKSVTEYKDIEHFASFDLENILTADHYDKSLLGKTKTMDSEITEKKTPAISKLSDYYDRELPLWFVKKLRSCEVNGSFLQNACVNHRIIFYSQVEMLREISSYACSRSLRSLVYGIILGPLKNNDCEKPSRNYCIEEYDRQGKDTKKFYVQPVDEISSVMKVPCLEKIPSLSIRERKNILYSAFGFASESESLDENMDEASKLFVLSLSLWVKNAQPKLTESHLDALIICVIALHWKQLKWLNVKKDQGFTPYQPTLYEDLVQACNAMPERQINFFNKNTEKHFSRPAHSAKIPRDNKVVHGFAQFQACFLDTLYLNQVLLNPVCIPSPSAILNCTFLYNLCRDLESRAHSDLYIAEILGRGSSLHNLFLTWKKVVVGLCKENTFEEEKKSVKSRKKKSKSKGKTTKVSKPAHNSDEERGSEEAGSGSVTINCDVSNKFALLDLHDS